MFKSSLGAQKRFFRKTGDGALKFLNTLFVIPFAAYTGGRPDEYGFILVDDRCVGDGRDETASNGADLATDIGAINPYDEAPLLVFDARPDETVLQPDGLNASPAALIEEAMAHILPSLGKAQAGTVAAGKAEDCPDRDLLELISAWASAGRDNYRRLCTRLFDKARNEADGAVRIVGLFAIVSLGALGASAWLSDIALLAGPIVAALGAVAILTLNEPMRAHDRALAIATFKALTRESTTKVYDHVLRRQTQQLHETQRLGDDTVLQKDLSWLDGQDERAWLNSLKTRFAPICRNLRRMTHIRECLRIHLRALGMSYIADTAHIQYAAMGVSWRLDGLAVGLVPRSALRVTALAALTLAAGLPVATVCLARHGWIDVLPDHIGRTIAAIVPASDLQLGSQAACLAMVVGVAWIMALRAQARITPPFGPDIMRHIAGQAEFQNIPGPMSVGDAMARPLLIFAIRLIQEENKHH